VPFLQVHTARPVSPEAKHALGIALARAYADAMETSHRIVNVGFVDYPDGGLVRYDASNDGRQEMTIVTCHVRAGRTPAQQESLGRALTELCARALRVPEVRIAVYISEHAGYQIYRDGGRAPDWSPAEAATAPKT
jgi:phenylpyruvate tautomerase PptA (4-oxalocrotonate tautomerase family)